jgi:hypothetical protein
MQKEAKRLKILEERFYQQALAESMIEELNETEEDRIKLQEFASMIKALAAQHHAKPDPEKIEWFEHLPGAVVEFAKNCDLDVSMSVNHDFIGSILFETDYLELSSFDDPVIRHFWLYLCQHGQLTIEQKTGMFSIEFRFDLRAD